jgi:hypothetical protein
MSFKEAVTIGRREFGPRRLAIFGPRPRAPLRSFFFVFICALSDVFHFVSLGLLAPQNSESRDVQQARPLAAPCPSLARPRSLKQAVAIGAWVRAPEAGDLGLADGLLRRGLPSRNPDVASRC